MNCFTQLQKMQTIRQCVQRFISSNIFNGNNSNCLSSIQRSYYGYNGDKADNAKGFLKHNETIFPPQKPGEEKRPGVSLFLIAKMIVVCNYNVLHSIYIIYFTVRLSREGKYQV